MLALLGLEVDNNERINEQHGQVTDNCDHLVQRKVVILVKEAGQYVYEETRHDAPGNVVRDKGDDSDPVLLARILTVDVHREENNEGDHAQAQCDQRCH